MEFGEVKLDKKPLKALNSFIRIEILGRGNRNGEGFYMKLEMEINMLIRR